MQDGVYHPEAGKIIWAVLSGRDEGARRPNVFCMQGGVSHPEAGVKKLGRPLGVRRGGTLGEPWEPSVGFLAQGRQIYMGRPLGARRGCTLGSPWKPSVGCLAPRPARLFGPSSRGETWLYLGSPWEPWFHFGLNFPIRKKCFLHMQNWGNSICRPGVFCVHE